MLSGIDDDGVERKIFFGPVVGRGKDLPLGKNLADYICPKLFRMNVLMFFIDHKKLFPTIFKVCQCEASRRMVEVACERFLSLAGYVSSRRCTRLGVRTYERLAILSSLLQNIYIDDEWCAKEYLRRNKSGNWDQAKLHEALK